VIAEKRTIYMAKIKKIRKAVILTCSFGKDFESWRKNNITCSPKCSQREYREKNKHAIRERKALWDAKRKNKFLSEVNNV
jgi:hypothetical protein